MLVDTVYGEVVLKYIVDVTGHFAVIYDQDEDVFRSINLKHIQVEKKEKTVKEIFCAISEYYSPSQSFERLKEFGIIKEEE